MEAENGNRRGRNDLGRKLYRTVERRLSTGKLKFTHAPLLQERRETRPEWVLELLGCMEIQGWLYGNYFRV